MVYRRAVSPEQKIARAWSAGYLSSRGYLGISNGSMYLELKARGAAEELDRFTIPIDDLKYSRRVVKQKGVLCDALYVRGDSLIQTMERLAPYVTNQRMEQYNKLYATYMDPRGLRAALEEIGSANVNGRAYTPPRR